MTPAGEVGCLQDLSLRKMFMVRIPNDLAPDTTNNRSLRTLREFLRMTDILVRRDQLTDGQGCPSYFGRGRKPRHDFAGARTSHRDAKSRGAKSCRRDNPGITLFPILTALVLFAAYSRLQAAGLDDLDAHVPWKNVANGVWSAEVGDMANEIRYTDLAAAKPRLEQLNALSNESFPFVDRKIRFRLSKDHKVVVHIPAEADEKIFGYGLQFDTTQKNGQILDLKVDHFNKGGGATHAPVPFYISSKGYGVFFNTAKYLKVYNNVGNRKDSPNNPLPVDRNAPEDEPQPGPWLAKPPSDAVEGYVHADGLELVVFAGNSLQDVVARYNLFSGGGAMPPLWGLGFWHRVPSKFSADQTLKEIAQFAEHNIPLDVIGLEPGWQTKSYPCTFQWQKKRFPDPRGFCEGLLARGIRLNLWVNPYISPDASIYKSMYPLSGSHLVWLGIVPDYTLPAARRILVEQHQKEHIDIGISGYKIDEVDGYDFWLWPDHATFPSGTPAEAMRQTYGLLMQRMLHHDLFRQHNQRTYGLVRASNGAASGYPFVIYSDSYGHRQYVTGLSAASLCGILWCPEIRSAGSSREWLNRMHTVCFSPLAMLNAWASGQKPWSFADVTDSVREVIQLRMRLLPYLYTAFADYHQKGIPPVRSMLLETGASVATTAGANGETGGVEDPYADGVQAKLVEDNSMYMFGPSILVAPFFEKQATQRIVNLPAGNWYDFYTGELVGNGQSIRVNAAQMKNRLPLFVKEGAVIPMLSKPVNNTEDAYGHPLEVRHYGSRAGSFTLYEDDGKSYDFERGGFRLRRISVSKEGELTETVEASGGPALFGRIETVKQMSDD